MLWVRLSIDIALVSFAVGARLRAEQRPSSAGVGAVALPTVALVVLVVLAGLSSSHGHRASHAGVALAGVGCLAAAVAAWTGMRLASSLRSIYRIPLVIYGLVIGLFFGGEAIAVIILNW